VLNQLLGFFDPAIQLLESLVGPILSHRLSSP
jgi:hypothetical protein